MALPGVKYPGKYLGLAEKGTKNKEGEATGLDYLKSLGITHVQIMPMYDFASIDEAAPKKREYNWGYDPLNYNVPEGSFFNRSVPWGGAYPGNERNDCGFSQGGHRSDHGCGVQSHL